MDAKGILYVANFGQCNIKEYLSGKDHPYQTITDEIDGPVSSTARPRSSSQPTKLPNLHRNQWLHDGATLMFQSY